MQIQRIDIKTLSEAATSVFLSEKYLSIYDDNLEPYGIFKDKSGMIGGFVLYKQKRSGITYYRNPMYMPSIGLFFENTTKNKSKKLSENKKVMKAISDFLANLSYGVLSIYLPYNHIDMQPFFWKEFKVIPNYTYHIDLHQSIDSITQNYVAERRSVIKRALKDGVEVQFTHDYSLVKKLVLKTFSRKDKQIDIDILDKILFKFADDTNSFAYIAYQNERPISSVFCIYDKTKVYYLLGGYDNEYKHQGAGSLAIDVAIKKSKEMDIPIFDFEGSMIPEVEKYFRGFGGDLIPYYSINKATLPLEMVLKFINRSHF